MTIRTLEFKGERYVLIREEDFRALSHKSGAGEAPKRRRLTAQDRGDIAEALRRLADKNDRAVPYERARRRLRLA